MQAQSLRALRHVFAWAMTISAIFAASLGHAAPYAAMVMDARNGEVIFARNHDTRLHPASLTKMMTLYVAFEAVKHGEVTLDTQFTVSQRATGTPCVCLGLRPGQRISLRYLLRAAALRSANDASVVIAEGISGSVEAFAERMTRTARAMGMENTTFRNPHGLTQTGHMSTARDMTILGRQLYFDYPQYFNMFSRRSDHAGVAVVPNTNRRFLDAYSGADGIKTGFTRAAGFNLTASAQRGGKHIIATMFGGTSVAQRNAHVAELMDIGFSRAPTRVATRAPRTPAYQGRGAVAVAAAPPASASGGQAARGDDDPSAAAKTIRLQMAVRRSPRPLARPVADPPEELLIAVLESVETAVAETVSGQALEVLPVAPPPRDIAALSVPDPEGGQEPPPAATPELIDTIETQLATALDAGFGLALAEESDLTEALVETVEQAQADVAAEHATEPVADIVAGAVAEATAELARAQPRPRPDHLVVPFATAEALPEPEAEHASPLAVSELAQVAATADLAAQAPSADSVWIGANETISAGLLPPQHSERAGAATVTVGAENESAPAPGAPGIILTSASNPLTVSQDRQAIAEVVEAHVGTEERIVTRVSTSDGGRLWGVSLGQFNSRAAAERGVIAVKMAEAAALANGVSRIRQTSGRFEASFAGLTQAEAERACLRLSARSMDCAIAHP